MSLYHNVRFEFNVYVNAQGNGKVRQNHLWHKPITPPEMLREALNEVIPQVKSVYELEM